MRPFTFVTVTLALTLSAATALAVTEPNGLQVPIDSSPEIQLYTLFQQRGENINWQSDAHTTPNSFSPLCGFTATYVLNQAGSHFGLAWYNDTGQPPQPGDLHPLVAPNSPVGTTFNGTAIQSDPAYMGGLVGFALVGGETHYTNSAYDTVCAVCNPNAPWITALMYASTVTPNAYYVCFEDGPTSSLGWSNDGDFNDDVYFITGITCSGGGQPCDTGKPGICGPGLTQCSANGPTCQELTPPAAMETCNGQDDDCNGQTDEGNICPVGKVCDKGMCVASCQGGEFKCPGGLACSNDGHCVDPACLNVTCPSGQVCVAGTCKGPCDGVTCPYPQTCRVGVCLDPCAGVTCGSGQVCDQGVCVTSCACQPCASGKTCVAATGECVDPACASVTCGAGTYCKGGQCVDDCSGAVCPSGQTCTGGACVAAPDGGTVSHDGGTGGLTGSDGGVRRDGGSADASASMDYNYGAGASHGGCGCRTAGAGGSRASWGLGLSGLALALTLRRRRRRQQDEGRGV